MSDFKIIVDYDLYYYDNSDSMFTKFFIEHQEFCFPDVQWTDFTASILGMWLYQLTINRYAESVRFKLYFMDGPFWMNIYKDYNYQLTIDCINSRGIKEVSVYTFVCSYFDCLQALYNANKRYNYLLFANNLHKDKFVADYNQTIISMKEIKKILY